MSRGPVTPPAPPGRYDKSPIPLLLAWVVAPLFLVLLLSKFQLGEWILQLFGG